MTKQSQCYKTPKIKSNRLSKKEYAKYKRYLTDTFSICQDEDCHQQADDLHHTKFGCFGAVKDDRTLIALCRNHHAEAHKNKGLGQKKYLQIANKNWRDHE